MFREDCNQLLRPRHLAIAVCFQAVLAFAQGEVTSAQGEVTSAPKVFDRVVASVEEQVITLSQLDFEARVLLVNAGVKAAFGPMDDAVLTKSLATIVDQRLVTLEADKLDTYPLEAGQLERAVKSFRDRFSNEAEFRDFLEAHEVEVNDLAQVLRRGLRAQRVLEGKLRLKAQVSDLEARQYVSQHPELKGISLELVRQRLFALRFQSLTKDEIAQARRQVDVRLLGPFAPTLRPSE